MLMNSIRACPPLLIRYVSRHVKGSYSEFIEPAKPITRYDRQWAYYTKIQRSAI